MDIVKEVTELIKSSIEEVGYILDEIIYVKEDRTNFLRIVIDKNGIIEVEDCVAISKTINPLLDKADLIKDSYILDVCSKEKGCE